MDTATACSVCSERTHHSSKCPELTECLGYGISKPPAGYSGDDEEDAIHMCNTHSSDHTHAYTCVGKSCRNRKALTRLIRPLCP